MVIYEEWIEGRTKSDRKQPPTAHLKNERLILRALKMIIGVTFVGTRPPIEKELQEAIDDLTRQDLDTEPDGGE